MGKAGRVFDDSDNIIDTVEGLITFCDDFITPDMVMVEIGCFRGVSTAIFARYAKTVYAVDPWLTRTDFTEIPRDWMEKAEPQFDRVMAEFPNIIKKKGLSVERARDFEDESLDAMYLDADHSEAHIRADLAAWIPKIKKGGVVAGHDYCMTGSLIPSVRVTVYPEQTWAYRKE